MCVAGGEEEKSKGENVAAMSDAEARLTVGFNSAIC